MPGGGQTLPAGIFAHGPTPPTMSGMADSADFVQENVEVTMNIMPGAMPGIPGRFRREAKGGGGRLPNRTG